MATNSASTVPTATRSRLAFWRKRRSAAHPTARRVLQTFPWAVEVFRLQGSVELAPLLELGDLAFDVVQTGETLRAHGLAELQTIAEVAPCVVASAAACHRFRTRIAEWVARLEAAEVAV